MFTVMAICSFLLIPPEMNNLYRFNSYHSKSSFGDYSVNFIRKIEINMYSKIKS